MNPTLLVVTYDLRVPVETFLDRAPAAAAAIAGTPGLVWKIWGLDHDTGAGTSAYLFRDRASAEAFAGGPALEALREGPGCGVDIRIAPVERPLSLLTHAGAAIAVPDRLPASA